MDAAILHITLEAPPAQDAGPELICPECGCDECQMEVAEDGQIASCPDCQAQWSPELNQVVLPESLARRTVIEVMESRDRRRLQETKDELIGGRLEAK